MPMNIQIMPLCKFQIEFVCIQHKDSIISVLSNNSLYLLDCLSRYILRVMYPLVPFSQFCYLGISLSTCKQPCFLPLSYSADELCHVSGVSVFSPHDQGIFLILFAFICHIFICHISKTHYIYNRPIFLCTENESFLSLD